MERWAINEAVGPGQPNKSKDVLVVQKLLNRGRQDDPHGLPLIEDGVLGAKTRARLSEFQTKTLRLPQADGIVSPSGPTARVLKRSLGDFSALRWKAGLPMHAPFSQSTPGAEPVDSLAAALRRHAAAPKAAFKVFWINRALAAARLVKSVWGVPIAVTLAQGALESNWGRAAPGNVFFGVKGRAPDGHSVAIATHEVNGTVSHGETDAFRSYDSLESSADDYGRFLATNCRYAAAFNYRSDPDKFIHMVAIAHYATDPFYESKIRSIMAFNGLKDYDMMRVSTQVYRDALATGGLG